MDWQITWNGRTWTDDDLTGGHVSLIMALQDTDSWAFCDPLAGPVKLLGVMTAFVSLAEHRPPSDVMQELLAARAVDLLDAVSIPAPASVPDSMEA